MYADDVDMIFNSPLHIDEADPVLAEALGEKHLNVNPFKRTIPSTDDSSCKAEYQETRIKIPQRR